jgi:cardiolipin synthase (CMP-forming)
MIANIPNALTILRILLAPVFLYLILNDILNWSVVVFAAAGLTDFLDGFLAKRFNLTSELGANLDPVADKLLLSSAFMALAFKGYVPVWLCVPVIIYDAAILAAVIVIRGSGKTVNTSPTFSGKMTTALQIITIFYALTRAAGTHDKALILLSILTVLVTAYSGLNYAMRELRQMDGSMKG